MVPSMQSMASLDELGQEVKDIVLGNTGTKVFFRSASIRSGWPGSDYMDESITEEAFAQARRNLGAGVAIVATAGGKMPLIKVPVIRLKD